MRGLRELGVEVVEHHRPVWERQRHKAGAFLRPGPLARAGRALRAGLGRPGRARSRASGRVDAVVAGYPAQPDAVPAWCVARARRVPLVVDMMISLADTLAGRPRAAPAAPPPPRWPASTGCACGSPTWCMADTAAGADWLAARFGVPRGRGSPSSRWAPSPTASRACRRPPGPPRALFYGKLAPLHGVATVLEAARAPRRAAGAADRRRPARALARGRARPRPPARASPGSAGCPTRGWATSVAAAGDLPGRVRHQRQGRAGGAEQGLAGDGRRPAGGDRRHARACASMLEDGRERPPGAARRRRGAGAARWPAWRADRGPAGAPRRRRPRGLPGAAGRPPRPPRARCATRSHPSNLPGHERTRPIRVHDWGERPELFGPRHDYREALILRRLLPALPGPGGAERGRRAPAA